MSSASYETIEHISALEDNTKDKILINEVGIVWLSLPFLFCLILWKIWVNWGALFAAGNNSSVSSECLQTQPIKCALKVNTDVRNQLYAALKRWSINLHWDSRDFFFSFIHAAFLQLFLVLLNENLIPYLFVYYFDFVLKVWNGCFDNVCAVLANCFKMAFHWIKIFWIRNGFSF